MYRKLMQKLLNWKAKSDRKPMLIYGARQVGKTWLMQEFGKQNYKYSLYFPMDKNPRMKEIFKEPANIKRIVDLLLIEANLSETYTVDDVLFIFDEIQEIPEALKSLKYFCEDDTKYHIIAAGSLLGLTLNPGVSYPVGKVNMCTLYPLDFEEFLMAKGLNNLAKLISEGEFEYLDVFSSRLSDLLKLYFIVGGMPAAVVKHLETTKLSDVREVQSELLRSYRDDFSKHSDYTNVDTVLRITQVWDSIPSQLMKENKEYLFKLLRKGARAKDFELAIQWLIDAGLIYKISNLREIRFPLKVCEVLDAFKLYMLDIGLLTNMTGLEPQIIIDGDKLFKEFKGALTEQYVLQQLIANIEYGVFYYTEGANLEIDFLTQNANSVVPIEVKAGTNIEAKSLKIFREKFKPKLSIKTSMLNYKQTDSFVNLPLYSICAINKIFKNFDEESESKLENFVKQSSMVEDIDATLKKIKPTNNQF
jgi:hypothetical protein